MSPVNEIVANTGSIKDAIGLIITGFAGSITHILNKARKGEKMSFREHLTHIFISGFVGYLSYLGCQYFGVNGSMQGIIIGISTYSGIQIIEALDMLKAKVISDLFLDFIRFKTGKK